MMTPAELEKRAGQYARENGRDLDLSKPLGFGQDGRVWRTHQQTAIKVFERQYNYSNERGCYQRLSAKGVTSIGGLAVPRLVDFDDILLVVELDIVAPPYVLDFGKAYLDRPPPFGEDQLEGWEEQLAERFGDDVSTVQAVLWKLQTLGIYYLDVKPDNIRVHPDPKPPPS